MATFRFRARVPVFVAGVLLVAVAVVLLSRSSPGPHRLRVHRQGVPTQALSPQELSRFAPLPAFSADSVWTSRVDGSTERLDPSSGVLVGTLLGMVNQEIAGQSGPWINTTTYSVPVYTVPAGQPLVPVVLNRTQPYAQVLKRPSPPVPPSLPALRPRRGATSTCACGSRRATRCGSSGTWRRVPEGLGLRLGRCHARRLEEPGQLRQPYNSWGATAWSLPLAGGLITPAELQSGMIPHALSFAMPFPNSRSSE